MKWERYWRCYLTDPSKGDAFVKRFFLVLIIFFAAIHMACTSKSYNLPSLPVPAPTATPTATSTPMPHTYVTQWGTMGSGTGQFNGRPLGISVDLFGNVYVADTGNYRIQKFSSAGVYLAQWGTMGTGKGQFMNPTGIMIDPSNHVYVVDSVNENLQKFTSAGT